MNLKGKLTGRKKKYWYVFIIIIAFLLIPYHSKSQGNFQKLSELINSIKLEMPSSFGIPNIIEYSFIHAECYCSISQATTGKKENENSITTFSFNLGNIQSGKLMVSKPKDSDYKSIPQDIWRIEIGTFDILVQNTDWQSRQTQTNHFFIYAEGADKRDQIIEFLKKSTVECGGSIDEVSILN